MSFFDPHGNQNNIDPKSDIEIIGGGEDSEEVPLCDSCKNVILKPYKEHGKLICPVCMRVYDPKYEYIQIQDKETTIDELSNQGKMGFVDEGKKIKQRTTLNRQQQHYLENLEYVNKEFDRYRQTEIIDDGSPRQTRQRYRNRQSL